MLTFDITSTQNGVFGGTTTGMTGNSILVSGSLLLVSLRSSALLSGYGITFNGTAMTVISSHVDLSGSGWVYIFGLLNPTTGSSISPIATWASNSVTVYMHAVSYTSTSTSLPTVTNFSQQYVAGSGSASLTTDSTANSWIVGYIDNGASATMTAGSGTVIRSQAGGMAWADSGGTVAASTTSNLSFTWSSSTNPFIGQLFEVSPGPVTFTASDALTGSDTAVGQRGAIFTTTDTTSLSEAITAVRGAVVTIADTLGLTDLLSLAFKWMRGTKASSNWTSTTRSTSAWSASSKAASTWTNTPRN